MTSMTFSSSGFNYSLAEVKNNPNIECVDSALDGRLELYCYTEALPSSDAIVRECRGVVFDTTTGSPVMKTFGYTPEFNEREVDDISAFLASRNTSLDDCLCFESNEGALIRLVFLNDEWHVLTHRKFNAYKSKWSSRTSFGELFESAINHLYTHNGAVFDFIGTTETPLQTFMSNLDTSYVHTFLLLNNEENRIVCNAPSSPTTYYVGSFSTPNGSSLSFLPSLAEFPQPKRHTFSSTDELCKHVSSTNYRNTQGIIIFTPDMGLCKVINSTYQYYYRIRGNMPSIRFRYLQVRNNGSQVASLKHLYPIYSQDFVEYEKFLNQIAHDIHSAYIKRFIKKEFVRVSQDEYKVIRDCHGQHIADRNVKITLDKIREALSRQPPTVLNRLIKAKKHPNEPTSDNENDNNETEVAPVDSPGTNN